MDVLVCIKRVPMVGGRISLTEDGREVDTRLLGFTMSPHEECAVEEAVRLVERDGGSVTVLTLGPPEAADQLRDAIAVGANRAVLLKTDGREWGPTATAEAIATMAERHRAQTGWPFDLLLFGNEAADTGDYQVAVRVAHLLGRPCALGIKSLEIDVHGAHARREYRGVTELFELPLPAVVSVKEGINLPRYPSLPGRMRAKKALVEEIEPEGREEGLRLEGLRVPVSERRQAALLGRGVEAVPALVDLLEQLGVLS
ncbi:MAG TPA: electron transfer flavoprotein subunit beta/FixA family protein [Acidimicrobiales bacterium]|nr:electron transfer flavoprotein subunit beta/FixA family protein [Acidimicrobiales bacterium]